MSTREASADGFATGDVLRDRCCGCLLGTAVGDALGAPGEFLSMAAIRTRFGPAGITRLHPWDDSPRGSVTGDTQMALATAEGLVQAEQAAREEALAVSLFCALRHPLDWRAAAVLAVNHDGDTDSTGAITGAILGSLLGVGAIPAEWAAVVEDGAAIVALADDLWRLSAEAPAGPQGPAAAPGTGR